MAIGACRIASAYQDPVKVRVIMVAQDRDHPVFPGERMELFQGLLGMTAAVDEIPEVHHHIHGAKCGSECRGSDTGSQRFDSRSVRVHIRKNYCTHTVSENIGASF